MAEALTADIPNLDGARRRADSKAIMAALVLGTFLTFVRAVGNDFISYDDPGYVTEARVVQRGLSVEGITWAFTTGTLSNWHPLTWLSHMLDVELFGLSPGGHHLTSVLFHCANAALLFLLLRRATGAAMRSAFAAALFAVHPLRVESVAWVSERKDVLSTFFGLLSLLSYVRYTQDRSRRAYLLTLLWLALGLMAKSMLVTLPCVMLLMDYWPLRRIAAPRDWVAVTREKLPMFALAAAASVVTFVAQRVGGAMGDVEKYPPARRAANVAVSYARYMDKTFWPDDLSIFYAYPRAVSIVQTTAAVILLASASAAAVALARRRPYVFTGWFWFVGTLVPVIGFVQVGRQAMADRYTYVPHMGLFIAIAWAAAEIADRFKAPRRLLQAGAAVALLALAATSIAYIGHWRNASAIFEHALHLDPENPLARHQLANELARAPRNDLAGAEAQYRAVLATHPDDALAHLNLGKVLQRRKRLDLAEPHYREAVRLKPNLAPSHLTLGLLLSLQDRPAEAEQCFVEALRLDPELALAHYHLGVVVQRQGRAAAARAHFNAALRLQPNLHDARRALESLNVPATTLSPTTSPL